MQLTFIIQKPATVVFDYLTDMQKFVSVHPVITRIDNLQGNKWLVHETLKTRFISFSFTYPVTVEQDFNRKRVHITATVMKLTTIEMSYTLYENNNTTIVSESITFKSLLPVQSILKTIFRKQHTAFFKNIEK